MKRITYPPGTRFGKWTILSFAGIDKANYALWNCVCDCGTTRKVRGNTLRTKNSSQCFEHRIKHGMKNTPTYNSWQSMLKRCTNPNDTCWSIYGAKGIRVCDRWKGEDGFSNFVKDMGIRPIGKTLDRFPDKNGDYTPENTRWADWKEQGRNRNGVKLSKEKADEIRTRYCPPTLNQRHLAIEYGVVRTVIQKILAGRIWT